jgi:hypothetical protein
MPDPKNGPPSSRPTLPLPPPLPLTAEELPGAFLTAYAGEGCRCLCGVPGGICTHEWDGEFVEIVPEDTVAVSSKTCTKCGMLAYEHDLWL